MVCGMKIKLIFEKNDYLSMNKLPVPLLPVTKVREQVSQSKDYTLIEQYSGIVLTLTITILSAIQKIVKKKGINIMKQKFAINGMSCNHCVATVEKAVNELPGIQKVKVNLKKNEGVVKFDESQINAQQIAEKVTAAGFDTEVV